MNTLLEIVLVLVGIVIGGGIVWITLRNQIHNAITQTESKMQAESAVIATRLSERDRQVEEQRRTLQSQETNQNALQNENTSLKNQLASLNTRLQEEQKAIRDQQALLEQAQARLTDAFKALSAEALNKNNQAFLDLAKTSLEKYQEGAKADLETRQKSIDTLVQPVKDSLQKFDEKVNQLEESRIEAYTGLTALVTELKEGQTKLQGETSNLVKALRTPVVRGRWGEIQLHRVVEMAGMLQYCDFFEQQSVATEDGALRPDMVVRLPGNRNIIIDSKAPLEAYLNALDAKDEDARGSCLKEHSRQVKEHFAKLGAKSYWEQFRPSPEFVVLFLPGESFFSAALEKDPGLIESCVTQKVVLATPTTLIALLKAIAYGWQQDTLEKNVREIGALGQELHERIIKMTEHLDQMGKSLSKSVENFNNLVGSFESRVLVTARKFKELGHLNSPDIPEVPLLNIAVRTSPALPVSDPNRLSPPANN